MYFSPQATPLLGADPDVWGLIATPLRWGKLIPDGYLWIADNGCFTGNWSEDKWLQWLDKLAMYQDRCVMATLPDVVADAKTTLERYSHYLPIVRQRGWKVGLVAQDGLESLPWPQDYDALFVGGSTAWKLSDAADWCIKQAQQQGKWVHVGRVNGSTRVKHFKLIDVDSVDGTTICFSPDRGFRKMTNALRYEPLFLLP